VTDSPPDVPASDPLPEPNTRPPARSASWLPWLLLLLMGGGGIYWHWQSQQSEGHEARQVAESREAMEALRAQLAALDRELDATRDRQRQIESRVSDGSAGIRVVREEVLGIAERSLRLEEAVAALAETRERGDTGLRLNEIEFLLQMAQERLQLFADVDAALAALDLAQGSLDTLRDPAYAGLRSALAAERQLLRDLPPDPGPALRRRISDLVLALPGLPDAMPDDRGDTDDSRLRQVLDRMVTVRRISESQAVLTPLERASRRAALQLNLGLALAAIETGDEAAWRDALQRALGGFADLFDPAAAPTRAARAVLEEAVELPVLRPVPALGGTLRELRAIRATRSVAAGRERPPAASAAAPEAAGQAPEAASPEPEQTAPLELEGDALERR